MQFRPDLFSRKGFLAGTDERRRRELDEALADTEARAVIAARGGYGLTRIVHAVGWRSLLAHPKWLVGFSDITALHVEAARLGVASLHAPNVAGLGRGDASTRSAWTEALEAPGAARTLTDLRAWRRGTATGPLFGGNLTVLFHCHAAGRLAIPSGAVLLLEDVSEPSYRLDRMLSALLVSGALDRVAAVVVGSFTDCGPGRHGVPTEAVLRERLGELGVPVVAGAPVGHGRQNVPVHLGYTAEVTSEGRVTLTRP